MLERFFRRLYRLTEKLGMRFGNRDR